MTSKAYIYGHTKRLSPHNSLLIIIKSRRMIKTYRLCLPWQTQQDCRRTSPAQVLSTTGTSYLYFLEIFVLYLSNICVMRNCPHLEHDYCVFKNQASNHLKNLNLPIVRKYGILQSSQQLWRQVNKQCLLNMYLFLPSFTFSKRSVTFIELFKSLPPISPFSPCLPMFASSSICCKTNISTDHFNKAPTLTSLQASKMC